MVGVSKLLPALTGTVQDKLMTAVAGKFYKEYQPPILQGHTKRTTRKKHPARQQFMWQAMW